jgi:hypothetical protein
MIPARTSIVINYPHSKLLNLQPYIYRCRNCDTNLTSNTPANQYQRLKIIQNTVRVSASEYTMNKASLNTYVKPIIHGVCWNQQSDRPVPSVQKATIPTGTYTSLNGKHTSHTSSRPGCQTPGGVGCDIKHNSYDRYLNRLKGKKNLRRGTIPPTFGIPQIPFNPAFPIYGGKQFKTAIVSNCYCPLNNIEQKKEATKIYNNSSFDAINEITFKYSVGMLVYAIENFDIGYVQATITKDLGGGQFVVQFLDGISKNVFDYEIYQYFPCNNCRQPTLYDTLINITNETVPVIDALNVVCQYNSLTKSKLESILS